MPAPSLEQFEKFIEEIKSLKDEYEQDLRDKDDEIKTAEARVSILEERMKEKDSVIQDLKDVITLLKPAKAPNPQQKQ